MNLTCGRAHGALLWPLYILMLTGVAAAAAATGDSVIDAYIAQYDFEGGNTLPLARLSTSNYGNALACGTLGAPSWEHNCPSDLTYLPNFYTGGRQAFGVGISSRPGGITVSTYCYYVEHPGSGDDQQISYDLVCDDSYSYYDPESVGQTVSRIRFGNDVTFTLNGVVRALSTAAFKASALPVCTPLLINQLQAPCSFQSDVTYVPQAGYEDKVVVPDPMCEMSWGRSGTPDDVNYLCFVAQSGLWFSDLPGAYIDTTAADGADRYIASVGSALPSQIQEGTTYQSRILFWSKAWQYPIVGTALHTGAITAPFPNIGGFCLAHQAEFGFDAACRYNVDQTDISEPAPILPAP